MFKRIAIAVDESEPAAQAVEVAIGLAAVLGSQVALVHVVDPTLALAPEGGIPASELLSDLRLGGEGLLLEMSERIAAGGRPAEAVLREGKPADEVLAAARDWGAELIVLGTQGRSRLERLLLGSTAEAVLRQAPCPVLTVRAVPAEAST